MYYIWTLDTDQAGSDYFDCGIDQFDDWDLIEWQIGNKIEGKLPEILKYYAVNAVLPNDYAMTGSMEFLISSKIFIILKQSGEDNIDYYESCIIQPEGNRIDRYFTANILNVVDCIDNNESNYRVIKYGPVEVCYYSKLVLNYEKIDSKIKLFRLSGREGLVVAHESIVEAFKEEGVTGIKFVPVEDYKD